MGMGWCGGNLEEAEMPPAMLTGGPAQSRDACELDLKEEIKSQQAEVEESGIPGSRERKKEP